jgi:hypothetical protein
MHKICRTVSWQENQGRTVIRIFRNYFDTLFNEKESIIADFHRFFACLIIEERLSFNIE